MKPKQNQINYSNRSILLISCFLFLSFLLISPCLNAQTVKEDNCDKWQSINAKVESSVVSLKLSKTTEGQEILNWANPNGKMSMMDIYKAKGPVNDQGKIEVCTKGFSLCNFKNSYIITELQKDQNLLPGYYAIRVIIGYSVGNPGESSDWITIEIK